MNLVIITSYFDSSRTFLSFAECFKEKLKGANDVERELTSILQTTSVQLYLYTFTQSLKEQKIKQFPFSARKKDSRGRSNFPKNETLRISISGCRNQERT